jgi:hypothetical protein
VGPEPDTLSLARIIQTLLEWKIRGAGLQITQVRIGSVLQWLATPNAIPSAPIPVTLMI